MTQVRLLFDAASNAKLSLGTGLHAAIDNVGIAVHNGTSWDGVRANTEGTLLALAARVGTGTSADVTNYNAKGVALTLTVTAEANAGDELDIYLQGRDPVSGEYANLVKFDAAYVRNSNAPSDTPMGFYAYPRILTAAYVGFAAPLGSTGKSIVLPRTWRAAVVPILSGDGGSWTYSLGYSMIR